MAQTRHREQRPHCQGAHVEVSPVSRREFLYYIWGASIALLLGEAGAAIVWFALPRFREGEFGGVIPVALDDLPNAGDAPVSIPSGRFHISHTTEGGFVILYALHAPRFSEVGPVTPGSPARAMFRSSSLMAARLPRSPCLAVFPVHDYTADGSTRTMPGRRLRDTMFRLKTSCAWMDTARASQPHTR